MGVIWAVEVRPEKEAKPEVDSGAWGFRVDGLITRRVTKLFSPDDDIWHYGELEARQVEQGNNQTSNTEHSDVQGGRLESFPVVGTTTAKLRKSLAEGDLSWLDEEDGEDRGGPYDRPK